MTDPNQTRVPRPKDLPAPEVAAQSTTVAHGGPTRKGHGNGLRVHATVFVTLSLAVIAALVIVFALFAGGRM